ncbi:hypothetical protein Btru_073599 [Bulinus truncatus]|nr:hypothetical protein Btru_073599 [Bulinus truncatus]
MLNKFNDCINHFLNKILFHFCSSNMQILAPFVMESAAITEITEGTVIAKVTSDDTDAHNIKDVPLTYIGLESETDQPAPPPGGSSAEGEIQQVPTRTQTPALTPTIRGFLPAFHSTFQTETDSGMMVDEVGCGETHDFKVDRSCTDVFCCVIFALFLIGLIATALYAFSYGDPVMLVYPQDSKGNLCGLGPYANKKYLFMFDLLDCKKLGPAVSLVGCPTSQDICIEKCPDHDFVFLEDMKSQNKKNLICKEGVNVTNKSVGQLIWDRDCAAYYLKSMPMLYRCIPDPKSLDPAGIFGKNLTLVNSYNVTIDWKILTKLISVYKDFLKAREYRVKIIKCLKAHDDVIFMAIFIAMLISFVWIVLMQWMASCMVWMSLGVFAIVWPLLSILCWRKYILFKGTNETALSLDMIVEVNIRKDWFYLSAGCLKNNGGNFQFYFDRPVCRIPYIYAY